MAKVATTIEESKKLLKLGLDTDTADTLNDYMPTTMTDKLPTSLTIDGTDYHLMEKCTSEHDKHFPNWWSFEYRRYDGKSLPPEAHTKTEWYHLSSIAPTKEDAYNQLLEKVNNMVDE